MADQVDVPRGLAGLVVPDVGRLVETGDPWEPYRLLDANGAVVEPVAVYLAELQAGRPLPAQDPGAGAEADPR
jgi:hypothetical protein